MKTGIHPKYFESVEIRCSCGHVTVAGSTREKLKTELCSNCHPFFTGQQKLIDTAGRVDKFFAKKKLAEDMKEKTRLAAEHKKKKPEAYKEKEVSAEVLARAMGQTNPEAGKWESPLGVEPITESAAIEMMDKESSTSSTSAQDTAAKKPAKKAVTKKAKKAPAK